MDLLRKEKFHLPEGVIYLDGNSLGPMPKDVPLAVNSMIENEWATHLIKGWNECAWMDQPKRVGNKIAKLLGAPDGSIIMGDTLSIKVFQALDAALSLRSDRKVILSDNGNFPSDLYMAEGLIRLKSAGYELRTVPPEDVANSINADVAAVMLTEVDYRTGRRHDVQSITEKAHSEGCVMIWDLAHSAGALEVNLEGSNCEFAIGCTYKYLNGGPGAPAFIYVRPDLIEQIQPALSGWLGHHSPFAFELSYRPGEAIERMRVGTPPVIQLAALEKALDLWSDVDMQELRDMSLKLSRIFIEGVEARCPSLELISPRNNHERGSQVSFGFENGYAAMQAIIARGVIGDFRAPNVMRFGFTPLYIDETDVKKAVDTIDDVINNRLWDHPNFLRQNRVT